MKNNKSLDISKVVEGFNRQALRSFSLQESMLSNVGQAASKAARQMVERYDWSSRLPNYTQIAAAVQPADGLPRAIQNAIASIQPQVKLSSNVAMAALESIRCMDKAYGSYARMHSDVLGTGHYRTVKDLTRVVFSSPENAASFLSRIESLGEPDESIIDAPESMPVEETLSLLNEAAIEGGATSFYRLLELKWDTLPRPLRALLWLIFSTVVAYYANAGLDRLSKRAIVKASISQVAESNSVEDRKELRVVTASVLNVRGAASRRSGRIANLFAGDVVKVMKSKKDWTLVEWDEKQSDSVVRGWVFTRYLEKVR